MSNPAERDPALEHGRDSPTPVTSATDTAWGPAPDVALAKAQSSSLAWPHRLGQTFGAYVCVLTTHVRQWELWRHTSRRGVAWMLTWELAILVTAVGLFAVAEWPTVREWVLFGLLVCCAGLHMVATQPSEERRRAGRLRTEYVDHTGVWTVGAALVLPSAMTTLLIVGIGVHRWRLARKPPCRVIFTNTAVQASALAGHWLSSAVPELTWLRGHGPIPTTSVGHVVVSLVALTGVLALYFAAQTLIIGVARLCLPSGSSARSLHPNVVVRCVGTWPDNRELVLTLLAGFCCAVAANILLGVPLVLLSIGAVAVTRKVQEAELRDRQRRLDTKTGLLNPLGWARAARTTLYRHYLQQRLCALLLVDIDYFKKVNDTYGHHNGDVVLRAIGRTLQDSSRPGDLICRFGGEEFIALLGDTTPDAAHAAAERIRRAVSALSVKTQRPQGGSSITVNVTVSIGLALQRPASDEQLAVLLDHILLLGQVNEHLPTELADLLTELEATADTALYEAKNTGRDRVSTAPSEDHTADPTVSTPRRSRPAKELDSSIPEGL